MTPAYEGSNPASPVDYSSRISEKAGVWLLFVCREYICGETGEKMEIFGFNFKSKAEKEKEAIEMLGKHIEQFDMIYRKEEI